MDSRKYLMECVHPVLASWDALDEECEEARPEVVPVEAFQEGIDDEEDGLVSALKAMQEEKDAAAPPATSCSNDQAMATVCSEATATPEPNELLTWPLDDLSEERKRLGISTFFPLGNEDASGPKSLSSFLDIDGIQPVDFKSLRDDALLSIGVAMLWDWLPPSMTCDKCGGVMQLRRSPEGRANQDVLVWYCLNKGQVKQPSHSKHRVYCKAVKNVRSGMWFTKMLAPLANMSTTREALKTTALALTPIDVRGPGNG